MTANNISTVWEEIIGDIGLFGKSKSIKKLLRKNGYNRAEVVYIGDETRDIAAAKKAGVKSMAVSWGFNSKDVLASSNPDVLLEQPKDLLNSITRL
jgi:phosphoglycolate phosphatase-like HAD superfamily hydrolase